MHYHCAVALDSDITWLTFGLLQIVSYFVLITWLYHRAVEAKKGNDMAARSILFPVHLYALWGLALAELAQGVINTILPMVDKSFSPSHSNSSLVACLLAGAWGLYHVAIEGLALLLLQHGCGWKAFRQAGKQAVAWGLATGCLFVFIFANGTEAAALVQLGWEASLTLFYTVIWLAPLRYLARRPSVVYYARFWAIFRFINSIAISLNLLRSGSGDCLYLVNIAVCFCVFKTYVSYRSLLLEGRYWQGFDMFHSERALPTSPLNGNMDLASQTARALAMELDSLADLKGIILNSAFLEIEGKLTLGSGTSSKVFRGTWKKQACAVKMIYAMDITPEVVRSYCTEALLLKRIEHKHVVKLFGVCVVPPSICIVLELCDVGSLFSILHNPQIKLTMLDQLDLAIGAAKGVQVLHDRGVVHKDIKAMNFLVTHEQGASESAGGRNWLVKIADLELSDGAANWLAPECVKHGAFSSRSDMFAFGMVLFEIMNREVPYARMPHTEVSEMIASGRFPSLDFGHVHDTGSETRRQCVGLYNSLCHRCWDLDSFARPKAEDAVSMLLMIRDDLARDEAQAVSQVLGL